MNHNYLAIFILSAIAILYLPSAFAITTTITSTVTVTTTVTTTATITFNTTYTATVTFTTTKTITVNTSATVTSYAAPVTSTTTVTSTSSKLASTTSTVTVTTTTESHHNLTVTKTATLDFNNGVTSTDRSVVYNGIWTYGFFANYSISGDTFYYRMSNDGVHFTNTYQISPNLIKGFGVHYLPNTTMIYVAYNDNFAFGSWHVKVKNYTTNVNGKLIEPSTSFTGPTIFPQSSGNDHIGFAFAQTANYIYMMVDYAADNNLDSNVEEHILLYRAPMNTTSFTLITDQSPPCYPSGWCPIQIPSSTSIVPISGHANSVLFASFRETACADACAVANRTLFWWVYYGDNSTLKSFKYSLTPPSAPYLGFGYFDHIYLSQHNNLTYALLDVDYDWNYRLYKINSNNNITCAITAVGCAVSTGNNDFLKEPFHSFALYAYPDYLNILWLKKSPLQNLTKLMLDVYDYNGTLLSSQSIYNFQGGNFNCGFCFTPEDPERISGVQDGYNKLILTIFIETSTTTEYPPSGRLIITYLSGIGAPASPTTLTISYTGYPDWYSTAPFPFPDVFYLYNTNSQSLEMRNTPQTVNIDLGSTWHVDNPFFGAYNDFWTPNQTSGVILGNTTIVINYTRFPSCQEPTVLGNLEQGCVTQGGFSIYGDLLFLLIDLIIFMAVFAKSNNLLLALTILTLLSLLTIVTFPQNFLRIILLSFAIGASAVIVRLLRRPST